MRRLVVLSVLALAAAPAAAASGPSPGVLQGGNGVSLGPLAWAATPGGTAGRTSLVLRRDGRVARTVSLAGKWGIPLLTFTGATGGVSHDGGTLVLGQATFPVGRPLRAVTRFLVLDARRLAVTRTIRLSGDFSYDALSPDGRILYLIQHTSNVQLTRYRVRAYDLRAGRLLPRVIADKRQASWVMNGMPIARAGSAGGRWQYTLYAQSDNYPFVHALDTVSRTAICVGIPWPWTKDMGTVDMRVAGGKVLIRIGAGTQRTYALDTKTLRVTLGG